MVGSIADPLRDVIAADIAAGNVPASNMADPLLDVLSAAISGGTISAGGSHDPIRDVIGAQLTAPIISVPATGEIQIFGAAQIGIGLSDAGFADSTNLLAATQNFADNTQWSAGAYGNILTAVDGGITDPIGGTNASKLTELGGGQPRQSLSQGFVGTPSTQHTFEVFIKQGLRTRASLRVVDAWSGWTNGSWTTFDVAGGQIGIAPHNQGNWTGSTAAIVSAGNGFFKCTISFITNSEPSGQYKAAIYTDAGSGTGAADDTYGVNTSTPALYVYGARLYVGAPSGSYVSQNTNFGVAASTLNNVFLPNGGTTNYWGTQTPSAWAGVNAGATVSWTRYRFAVRPSNNGQAAMFQGPQIDPVAITNGSLIQVAAAPSFASPTTLDTLPTNANWKLTNPYYLKNILYERPLSGSGSCIRMLPPSTAFGSFTTLQFFGTAGTTTLGSPVQPVISPNGGLIPGLSQTVTITSLTTNASIYYTLDGSTPSQSSTLYTAPFTLSLTSGQSKTVKAIAYQNSLSVPTSLVTTSAPFKGTGFVPHTDWYDTSGNLLDAHQGGVMWDPNTSLYYWVGDALNQSLYYVPLAASIEMLRPVINMYKSADLMNWTFVTQLPPYPAALNAVGAGGRTHLLYNAANNNYVLWTMTGTLGGTSVCVAATSGSDITSGWSWVNTNAATSTLDAYVFADPDSAIAYRIYQSGTGFNIAPLSANYQALSGSGDYEFSVTSGYEAPLMFKFGSTYFAVISAVSYLDSINTAISVYYQYSQAATPNQSGWNGSWIQAWASAPAKNTQFNGQTNCGFIPNGKTQPILMLDWWGQGGGIPNPYTAKLSDSRYVVVPVVCTATSLQIQNNANWYPAQMS